MKTTFKIIGKWVVPVALAIALPVAAHADTDYGSTLDYYWVTTSGAQASGSIQLTYDSSSGDYIETSYNFEVDTMTDTSLSPNDPFDFSDNVNINGQPDGMAILGDGSDTSGNSETGEWETNGLDYNIGTIISPTEIPLDQLNGDPNTNLQFPITEGYWAPVPEPSTIVSGALLLGPLAAGMVGMLRNRKSRAVVGGPVGQNTSGNLSRVERHSQDPGHLPGPTI